MGEYWKFIVGMCKKNRGLLEYPLMGSPNWDMNDGPVLFTLHQGQTIRHTCRPGETYISWLSAGL